MRWVASRHRAGPRAGTGSCAGCTTRAGTRRDHRRRGPGTVRRRRRHFARRPTARSPPRRRTGVGDGASGCGAAHRWPALPPPRAAAGRCGTRSAQRLGALQRRGGADELGAGHTGGLDGSPLPDVHHTEIVMLRAGTFAAGHDAMPGVGRVPGRDPDDVRAKRRVERRSIDQRDQQLQPVTPDTVRADLGQRQRHRGSHSCSPHTCRSARSNTGSCTSAWA